MSKKAVDILGGAAGGGIIPSLSASSRAESGGTATLASDFIVGGSGRATVPPWAWAAGLAALAFFILKRKG